MLGLAVVMMLSLIGWRYGADTRTEDSRGDW